MSEPMVHISICVCTFKRPALLAELLAGLVNQSTDGQFDFSIVVVDNDCHASARETVESLQRAHPGIIDYFVEQEQSIALARNRTVAQAKGALIAFIDDDEVPSETWLLTMYAALIKYKADGVWTGGAPPFVRPPESGL